MVPESLMRFDHDDKLLFGVFGCPFWIVSIDVCAAFRSLYNIPKEFASAIHRRLCVVCEIRGARKWRFFDEKSWRRQFVQNVCINVSVISWLRFGPKFGVTDDTAQSDTVDPLNWTSLTKVKRRNHKCLWLEVKIEVEEVKCTTVWYHRAPMQTSCELINKECHHHRSKPCMRLA